MGISDLAESMSTTQYFANGLLTKKQICSERKREARATHRYNERQGRIKRRELAKAQLETWHCFPHHDMLVQRFGRKGANYLGRRIKKRDDDLNLKSAWEGGDSILADADIVNSGFNRRRT